MYDPDLMFDDICDLPLCIIEGENDAVWERGYIHYNRREDVIPAKYNDDFDDEIEIPF